MALNGMIWPVGGAKGGTGKSVVAANIGCSIALSGRKAVVVDADPAGSGLHAILGVEPPSRGLDDFLEGRAESLTDVSAETPVANLRLISGAGEFVRLCDPAWPHGAKLASGIEELDADFVIVDLGEGSSGDALDFFAASGKGIVVMAPEPAAAQGAYRFLKSLVYRRLFRFFSGNPSMTEMIREATDSTSPNAVKSFSELCGKIAADDAAAASGAIEEVNGLSASVVLNMASSKEDFRMVESFMAAAKSVLGIDTSFAGALHASPLVRAASVRKRPFVLDEAATDARGEIEQIVAHLIERSSGPAYPAGAGPVAPDEAKEREVFGFNENVSHEGAVFHVQTEAQGAGEPFIETIVYNGGRIFFSKRTRWKDAAGGGLTMKEFATRQHLSAVAAVKTGRIKAQGQAAPSAAVLPDGGKEPS